MPTNGIVTLLTDFGHKDPFVGVMHGVLLSIDPALKVVDLCHGIAPQDLRAASFWLSRTYRYFPEGTCHVCVVDPGVGTERAALQVSVNGHHFIAPDNGVLGPLLDETSAQVTRIHPQRALPSRTFHGRDLFAPAAGELASKGELVSFRSEPVTQAIRLPAQHSGANTRLGRVVLSDHFGNLITNIEVAEPETCIGLRCKGRTFPWVGTYAQVADGAPLALQNSWGVAELGVRNGNAAQELDVQPGEEIELLVRPQTVD